MKDLIMKTVELQIEDTNFDAFLTVINNLKDGLIKNFKVQDFDNIIETVSDEEQQYYKDLITNMSEDDKQISSKETFVI